MQRTRLTRKLAVADRDRRSPSYGRDHSTARTSIVATRLGGKPGGPGKAANWDEDSVNDGTAARSTACAASTARPSTRAVRVTSYALRRSRARRHRQSARPATRRPRADVGDSLRAGRQARRERRPRSHPRFGKRLVVAGDTCMASRGRPSRPTLATVARRSRSATRTWLSLTATHSISDDHRRGGVRRPVRARVRTASSSTTPTRRSPRSAAPSAAST